MSVALASKIELRKLGDLCDIVRGSSPRPSSDPRYYGGPVPRLMVSDLKRDGMYVSANTDSLTLEGAKLSRPMHRGDLVIAVSGAPGLPAILNEDCCIHDGFVGLRNLDSNLVLSEFLCRYLHFIKDVSGNSAVGAIFKNLTTDQIKCLSIPLPPLAEQKRIAGILDKADAIRRKRQRAIELTEQFLRSTFLHMFGDPVTNPKGWPEMSLEQVAHLQSGVTKGRDLDGKQTIDVPYMRVWNVQDGHLRLDDIKDITVLPADVQKYRLETGDLLLTEGGDPDQLGRGAIWYAPIPVCIHQNHIFRVRPDQTCINPEFLSAIIGSERCKRYFFRMAKQTTGIASINMRQLRKCPILVPPLQLQDKYSEFERKFQSSVKGITNRFLTIDNLFNSLVQRAFRGQL